MSNGPASSSAISLTRRVLWRVARVMGGRFRRWAWDDQYKSGRWDQALEGRNPLAVSTVERLARVGLVVELACGFGSLITAVRPDAYSEYHGYDISEDAVRRARQAAASLGLTKCSFAVADISAWPGEPNATLIIIEEALYYLTHAQQRILLDRCVKSLKDDGRILVTAHSESKHRATLNVCREACAVIEEFNTAGRVHLVLGARRA